MQLISAHLSGYSPVVRDRTGAHKYVTVNSPFALEATSSAHADDVMFLSCCPQLLHIVNASGGISLGLVFFRHG